MLTRPRHRSQVPLTRVRLDRGGATVVLTHEPFVVTEKHVPLMNLTGSDAGTEAGADTDSIGSAMALEPIVTIPNATIVAEMTREET